MKNHVMRGIAIRLVYLQLFLVSGTCYAQEKMMTKSSSDATPFDITAGFRGPTKFMPRIDPDFKGIRINMPETVAVSAQGGNIAQGYIPISMTYQFSYAYIGKFDYIRHHMVVIAVDATTGRVYSGTLEEPDETVSAKKRPVPTAQELAEQEQTLAQSFLTFDLSKYLELPNKDAGYHVHVSLEQYQSNVVTFSLVGAGK